VRVAKLLGDVVESAGRMRVIAQAQDLATKVRNGLIYIYELANYTNDAQGSVLPTRLVNLHARVIVLRRWRARLLP